MVELSTAAAGAVAGGAGAVVVVLVVALVASVRRRRGAERRLAAVAVRMTVPGSPADGDRRDQVSRLERLAQATVLRLSDADARADRLAGALAGVAHAVVVCDENGLVVHRNAAAADLEGDDDGPAARAVAAVLAEARATGESARDVELMGPPRRTLQVRGRSLDDGRRVIGAVAVVEDVSERRRLDVTRRDFLANVTAELKAPVGALGLLAGTIVAEDDPALTRRLAHRLEQDALRVGRLVDDLTELSRLDAYALPVHELVAVDLLVAQAVEAAAGWPGQGSVTVTVDGAGAAPGARVVGDRRQLVAALRHLVENAVRFSGNGSPVRVTVTGEDGWVEVAVADDGPGIPPEEHERIFECFYRSDRDRARSPAGTGVGLAIAGRVAAGHGGQVRVVSEEGAGATFTLRLPAAAG